MAKRKKTKKNMCMMCGPCPGGLKHTISILAYAGLVYYILMILGVGGKLWLSTLIIVILSYLAIKWCPAMDNCM